MVVGGAGDYFAVADTVIMLENYAPSDVTDKAKAIAHELPTSIPPPPPAGTFSRVAPRCPLPSGLDSSRKVGVVKSTIRFDGLTELELGCVEQIVDPSQVSWWSVGAVIIATGFVWW